ncbi:MAG: hypothetical protein AB1631_31475, partial [Acidobacteriota bacterium]
MNSRRVMVPARIQEMATDSVQALIGPLRYQQIASIDPAPMFVQMTVAHEGVSTGEVAGLGNRVKEWARGVIRRLAELLHPSGRVAPAIYDGSKVYHGNQSRRQPCGEIVHSREGEQSGLATAESIGYIYAGQQSVRDSIRRGELDTCSIEADVFLESQGRRAVVSEVVAATAVVLGDSRKQQ